MAIRPCPNPNRNCRYFLLPPPEALKDTQEHGCHADDHHEFYPEADYEGDPIAHKYRTLGRFIINICRREHDMEHRLEPPEKPPVDEMIQAIEESGEHVSRSVRKAIEEHRRE